MSGTTSILIRNKFRVHGDTVDIYLAYMSDLAIRVEFFGDEIDRITEFNPLTGSKQNVVKHVAIFPASHYIVSAEKNGRCAGKDPRRVRCAGQTVHRRGQADRSPAHCPAH